MSKTKTGYVYALVDKLKNPYYIGGTENLETRKIAHLTLSKKSNKRLYKYIRDNELSIELIVLETVNFEISDKRELWYTERKWIIKLTKRGHKLQNDDKHKKTQAKASIILDSYLLYKARQHCKRNGFFFQKFIEAAIKEKIS